MVLVKKKSPQTRLNKLVFVTGNKNKLCEVQAILKGVIDVESHNLDRKFYIQNLPSPSFFNRLTFFYIVPELQGETQEIAKQKCKLAAETVRIYK